VLPLAIFIEVGKASQLIFKPNANFRVIEKKTKNKKEREKSLAFICSPLW
jgi:hypothetical protein